MGVSCPATVGQAHSRNPTLQTVGCQRTTGRTTPASANIEPATTDRSHHWGTLTAVSISTPSLLAISRRAAALTVTARWSTAALYPGSSEDADITIHFDQRPTRGRCCLHDGHHIDVPEPPDADILRALAGAGHAPLPVLWAEALCRLSDHPALMRLSGEERAARIERWLATHPPGRSSADRWLNQLVSVYAGHRAAVPTERLEAIQAATPDDPVAAHLTRFALCHSARPPASAADQLP